jgi:signal transduction histidine kinase/CheY-like chemotaxis protein
MGTATLNFTRELARKVEDETGAEKSNGPQSANVLAAGTNLFEIVARAANDTVRDWVVTSGLLTWPYGLEAGLGHPPRPSTNKIGFWFNHLHPDDRTRIQSSLKEAFESPAERWTAEYRFRRGDGQYRHIRERALIIRSADGAALRLVGTMMDVTEHHHLQAQACRSQRMEAFGQLAGGVAHDFNNFLTTILGYSDLLLSENAVKGAVAEQVQEIRAAAGRASALTNQLLAFSRRQTLEPGVFEVNSLIHQLERSLLRLLGDDLSIVCHLHRQKEGAHIKVDPGQFTQIILNLAVNARDAMRKAGRLTITTSILEISPEGKGPAEAADIPPGEYVAIAVSDNGRGMDDEVKARLFEPIFTTKDKARYSGLGLATTYGIVRQSDGHIRVESEPERGSTFRIFLPRVAPPPPAAYRKPGQRKNPTGTETVLVVEDEVGVRHLSVRILRSLGYEVIEAAHGDDAKRLLGRRGAPRIDLLLTDMVMPEMSGRHFADWLRAASPLTRVIFISGYLEESLHPHDRRDPGMKFLAKPFSAEQLAHKVREVLDEKVPG